MKVKSIHLAWFRGAADQVSLDPNCKSMVVYGVNGSGKSSFVDAVEYMVRGGKISHLAHEYSGKHQEKAIPNTHRPRDRKTELRVRFEDDSEFRTEIADGSSSASTDADGAAIQAWDYRRTVLRQDEVAAFIHSTKGRKYSALLPLLGLDQMEVAAENLRQLVKSVRQESKLIEIRANLKDIDLRREAVFGNDNDDLILARIKELHAKYCPKKETVDARLQCMEIEEVIEEQVKRSSVDQRRHFVLQRIAWSDLKKRIEAVRVYSGRLAAEVGPLVVEKLNVLRPTDSFVSKLGDEEEVLCPACGQMVAVTKLQTHVRTEIERSLADSLGSLKANAETSDVKSWRDELVQGVLASSILHLDGTDPAALQ